MCRCLVWGLAFSCLIVISVTENTSNNPGDADRITETWADKLKKDLLINYDPNNRPTNHFNVTHVDIKITISHVEINEDTSVFSVFGYIKMLWNDDKLKWDPKKYANLDVIRTNPESVWKPDLMLYNNAKGGDNLHYGLTNMLIYSDGRALWVPPIGYSSFCELNLHYWPFDYQTCFLKIGSWTFDGYKLNLTANEEPELIIGVPNNQWSIKKVTTDRHTTFYKCCTEPYIDIQYNITMQRQSSTYKAIVVSPAFVIILLALSVFLLPPQSGQKIVLNGVIVLMVVIFLMYFAQQLPAMSGHTPLIVTFFSTTLYLVAISTIISVITIRISRTRHSQTVPRILKGQLDGFLGSLLGVSTGSVSSSEKDKEAATGCVESSCDSTKQNDWCRLASLIDRLAFVVYVIIFVISIVHYSL